jgi:hypothetical protein
MAACISTTGLTVAAAAPLVVEAIMEPVLRMMLD